MLSEVFTRDEMKIEVDKLHKVARDLKKYVDGVIGERAAPVLGQQRGM